MTHFTRITRRTAVKSSVFGLLAISFPHLVFVKKAAASNRFSMPGDTVPDRYPAIADALVAEVVGASHFNLDRVKELVNKRPELARATWDWAFGDWETALGAASHVGRRDIAEFLMSKGARPDIFTYAMLGAHKAVRSMIENTPGIQSVAGPHGISLLQHAKNGLRSEGLKESDKKEALKLISYLESLGNADPTPEYIELSAKEKEKYLGDYRYGPGTEDGFSIRLNMRKQLSLGKIGKFGGAINQKADNLFDYNGTTSVKISFDIENGIVRSLTVNEPDLVITAKKI